MCWFGAPMILLTILLSCGFPSVCEAGSVKDCYRETCMSITYDIHEAVCCGNKLHPQGGLSCCGQKAYNPAAATCCKVKHGNTTIASITLGLGKNVSSCCGLSAYNELNEICCESTIKEKPAPKARCCGAVAIDEDKFLCCGQNNTILTRQSHDEQCCGYEPYNTKTHCCCQTKTGVSKSIKSGSQSSCCSSSISDGDPWIDQGEDGGAEAGDVYNPATGTICCSHFHGSHRQHCCGTEIYQPAAEICCNGHKHLRIKNIHLTCCGIKAYNIKDRDIKCCAGTLYNLSSIGNHGDQCCGSILHNSSSVCCSSEDMELLYSVKPRFKCCGHFYYNTSLWSCCAGKLSPVHCPSQHPNNIINESRLLSLNNLNRNVLCKTMHIGIMESVSLDSIVFRNVLEIHGRNATIKPLPSPHILKISDRCNSPKLIPGKTYLFHNVNFFADFKHYSGTQSLHFIFSKCSNVFSFLNIT
ncbi:hypothetical protein PAMA_020480 [Pampus argenteus]